MSLKQIWSGLVVNKLRTGLAITGITVGTASVVGLLYCGLLAADFSLNKIREMGTQLIAITVVEDNKNGFSFSQLEQINLRHRSIEKIVPIETFSSTFEVADNKFDAPLLFSSAELVYLLPLKIREGRFLSQADKPNATCVLGDNIVKKIARHGLLRAIGDYIFLNGAACLVVGELMPLPNNFFLPLDLNEAVITNISHKHDKIRNVLIKFKSEDDLQNNSNFVLADLHAMLPDANFYERTPKFLYDHIRSEKLSQQMLLGVIAAISLLVGGIGIMNIMLVSVWERESEIGLRLALGASKRAIKLMFLSEGLFLCLIGGLFGVIFALAFSCIFSIISGWTFSFYLWPILIGILASFIIGIFFGYYPASRAANFDPINSLKGV